MRSPTPSAKRISVADGARDTMRRGAAASVRDFPRSSVIVSGYRAGATVALGVTGAGAGAATGAVQAARIRTRDANARRTRMDVPLSREREWSSRRQATWLPAHAGHSGGTAPESHRLRCSHGRVVVSTFAGSV